MSSINSYRICLLEYGFGISFAYVRNVLTFKKEDTMLTKVTREDVSPVNEEDAFKEEKDDVFVQEKLEAKSKKSLAYKRSFFVRMVSDPKLYNPKIVPTKSCDVASLEDQHTKGSSAGVGQHNINIEGVKIYDDIQPPSPTM